jgi:starvation-inducible DNA-binding protein
MQPTHNTLSENIRAQSVELLNKHLAAAIDLHAQVKQAASCRNCTTASQTG